MVLPPASLFMYNYIIIGMKHIIRAKYVKQGKFDKFDCFIIIIANGASAYRKGQRSNAVFYKRIINIECNALSIKDILTEQSFFLTGYETYIQIIDYKQCVDNR